MLGYRLQVHALSAHFFSQYNKIAAAAVFPITSLQIARLHGLHQVSPEPSVEAAYAVCDILMLTRVRVGKDILHVRQRARMGDRRQIVDFKAY